jgi:hypothetical protein
MAFVRFSGGMTLLLMEMQFTDYQAKYFAFDLTKRCPLVEPPLQHQRNV